MKMNMIKPIWTIVCLFASGCAFSQTEEAGQLLRDFESRFAELDSLIHPARRMLVESNDHSPPGAVVFSHSDAAFHAALDRRVAAETEEFRSRTGLQLTGQAYYRPGECFGTDDQEAVSRYGGKAQVELRWSVLQSSLVRRKGQINEIRIRGEIDRLIYESEALDAAVVRHKAYFRQRHDSLLCGVLRHRICNLSLLGCALDYLLRHENIGSDELLNILNEKAEAERKLATVDRECYPRSVDLSGLATSKVIIDSAGLLRHIRERQRALKLLELRRELLEQQEANAGYWSKADIAPFLRYSHYTRRSLRNSSNIDVGVSFKLPISARTKREKQTLRTKRELLFAMRSREVERITDEVHFILDDIARLNRSIEGEYARCDELRRYLLRRGETYSNRIGEYSRLARMKEYDEYLLCLEKIIEYRFRQDCRIADLARYLADEPILKFCREEMMNQPVGVRQ